MARWLRPELPSSFPGGRRGTGTLYSVFMSTLFHPLINKIQDFHRNNKAETRDGCLQLLLLVSLALLCRVCYRVPSWLRQILWPEITELLWHKEYYSLGFWKHLSHTVTMKTEWRMNLDSIFWEAFLKAKFWVSPTWQPILAKVGHLLFHLGQKKSRRRPHAKFYTLCRFGPV